MILDTTIPTTIETIDRLKARIKELEFTLNEVTDSAFNVIKYFAEKNMYIIVSWNGAEDAAILTNIDGENETFSTKDNAIEFARENCAWHYKIIEI